MKPIPEKREQAIGWILAGLMALHLFAFHPQVVTGLAAFIILLAGAALRGRHIHAPRWFGNTLLLLGVVAISLVQESAYMAYAIPAFLGEQAVTAGAILLLRPVTPALCQRVIFCLLLVLTAIILRSGVGQTLIVIDVAATYLILEEAVRPPDAIISFWVSLTHSFRVIVPVGIVVLSIFWFFPSLSAFFAPGATAVTGFSGSNSLDARFIAELSQSWRTALVAHFAPDETVPFPDSIYWRGQVLENDDGFYWSVADSRITHVKKLLVTTPAASARVVRYSQEITENRGMIPVLDHGVFIEAKSNGQGVAITDNGAGTLASGGIGQLTLRVVSSIQPLTDAPDAAIQQGSLQVPRKIRESATVQEIAAGIFGRETGTPGKLRALSDYFRKSGFHYTMRPGRIQDMANFLNIQRAGFCSHYAMAAANLLRLAQVPTRVISGYRGGEWNPWLRTITVRDSDAHAWVEAWDGQSHRWLRYDPTDSVTPEVLAGVRREMDSDKWPWYRRDWSYGRFLATATSAAVQRAWDQITAWDFWDNVPFALLIALAGMALIWLVRNLRARRATGPQENSARLLLKLERRAIRLHRGRKPGETPLAWLDRLAGAASAPGEKATLRDVASAYETSVYKPGGSEFPGILRQDVRRLIKFWKCQPASEGSTALQTTPGLQS